jgi:hypothetical protein
MEQFKIDHFVSERRGEQFPCHKTLKPCECNDIRRRLCQRLGLREECEPLTVFSKLDELWETCDGVRAEDDDFDLESLVHSVGIEPQQVIFINWSRFDKIDKMSFVDLSHYFHDIWYPGPDDIEVFDRSFAWVLSVTHEGYIRFVRFSGLPGWPVFRASENERG